MRSDASAEGNDGGAACPAAGTTPPKPPCCRNGAARRACGHRRCRTVACRRSCPSTSTRGPLSTRTATAAPSTERSVRLLTSASGPCVDEPAKLTGGTEPGYRAPQRRRVGAGLHLRHLRQQDDPEYGRRGQRAHALRSRAHAHSQRRAYPRGAGASDVAGWIRTGRGLTPSVGTVPLKREGSNAGSFGFGTQCAASGLAAMNMHPASPPPREKACSNPFSAHHQRPCTPPACSIPPRPLGPGSAALCPGTPPDPLWDALKVTCEQIDACKPRGPPQYAYSVRVCRSDMMLPWACRSTGVSCGQATTSGCSRECASAS
eukprot:scaffold217_cov377-Prasinococcus_capsulatus_cf.AAC.35